VLLSACTNFHLNINVFKPDFYIFVLGTLPASLANLNHHLSECFYHGDQHVASCNRIDPANEEPAEGLLGGRIRTDLVGEAEQAAGDY
jgi:hypothetical protein